MIRHRANNDITEEDLSLILAESVRMAAELSGREQTPLQLVGPERGENGEADDAEMEEEEEDEASEEHDLEEQQQQTDSKKESDAKSDKSS